MGGAVGLGGGQLLVRQLGDDNIGADLAGDAEDGASKGAVAI